VPPPRTDGAQVSAFTSPSAAEAPQSVFGLPISPLMCLHPPTRPFGWRLYASSRGVAPLLVFFLRSLSCAVAVRFFFTSPLPSPGPMAPRPGWTPISPTHRPSPHHSSKPFPTDRYRLFLSRTTQAYFLLVAILNCCECGAALADEFSRVSPLFFFSPVLPGVVCHFSFYKEDFRIRPPPLGSSRDDRGTAAVPSQTTSRFRCLSGRRSPSTLLGRVFFCFNPLAGRFVCFLLHSFSFFWFLPPGLSL